MPGIWLGSLLLCLEPTETLHWDREALRHSSWPPLPLVLQDPQPAGVMLANVWKQETAAVLCRSRAGRGPGTVLCASQAPGPDPSQQHPKVGPLFSPSR